MFMLTWNFMPRLVHCSFDDFVVNVWTESAPSSSVTLLLNNLKLFIIKEKYI